MNARRKSIDRLYKDQLRGQELADQIREVLSDLNAAILRHVSQVSIGASALRNQGGKVIGPTRKYLSEEVSLDDIREALQDERAFKRFLNGHTTKLKRKYKLPKDQGWGGCKEGAEPLPAGCVLQCSTGPCTGTAAEREGLDRAAAMVGGAT